MYRSYLRSLACVALASLFAVLSADAQYTVNKLTNKSGGTVATARVVVADTSNASAFTVTATDDANRVLGVTTASVNNNAVGQVALFGMTEVYCDGAVALGDYLVTSSASAGYAESNGSDPNAAFAIAIEAGSNTNINCIVLGPTPTISGTSGSFSSIVNTGTYTGSGAITNTINDAGTNDVVTAASLFHTSSGTPASGLGAKLLLGAEDSAGNSEAAVEVHGYLTTVTNASEQGAFLLRVKNAGSFIDALLITVASNTATVGSNQTTANLWNTTATTVNFAGVATSITIGDATAATITLRGATLVGNTTTQNIFNTVATTGNLLGAATTLTVGAESNSGTTSIRSGTVDIGSTAGAVAMDVALRVTNAVANTNAPSITYRKARTSAGAFSQVQANDYLGQFGFIGYTNTPGFGINSAMFRVQALENFTSTAQGTQFVFETTAATTVTRAAVLTLATAGSTFASPLTLNASSTFGDASTDVFTFTGRALVRSVTDAGPMTATPGTQREIVYNTSDSKFYGCTVTHGTAATWVAFN